MNINFSHIGLALIMLVLLIVSLYLVDRYVYSIFGVSLKAVDFCDFKTVTIKKENSNKLRLSYDFDTETIAREMSKKDNYVVKIISGSTILITRKFGGVTYKMTFMHPDNLGGGFNVGTSIESSIENPTTTGGEKCSTPDYILADRINSMVDDLPLTEAQKKEMKQNIGVLYSSQFELF